MEMLKETRIFHRVFRDQKKELLFIGEPSGRGNGSDQKELMTK
jgi:hypothetical protein